MMMFKSFINIYFFSFGDLRKRRIESNYSDNLFNEESSITVNSDSKIKPSPSEKINSLFVDGEDLTNNLNLDIAV